MEIVYLNLWEIKWMLIKGGNVWIEANNSSKDDRFNQRDFRKKIDWVKNKLIEYKNGFMNTKMD